MLMRIFLLALIFSCGTIGTAQAAGTITTSGVLVEKDDCDKYLEEMKAALEETNKKDREASEAITDHTPAKEAACLPSLENLGFDSKFKVPCFSCISFEGIIDKITKAVCKAADNEIKRSVDNFDIMYKAPYGLGGAKIGVSTSGTKSTTDTVEPFSDIERAAIGVGSTLGKKAVGEVSDGLPNVNGVNRRLKKETNEQNSDVSDWRNGANDAIKNL